MAMVDRKATERRERRRGFRLKRMRSRLRRDAWGEDEGEGRSNDDLGMVVGRCEVGHWRKRNVINYE